MDSLVLSARVKEAEAANTDASEFQQVISLHIVLIYGILANG